MQVEGKSQKLLRIHRADNVLIVVRSVKPGDREVIDGHDVVFTQEIGGSRHSRRGKGLQVWCPDWFGKGEGSCGRSYPSAQPEERLHRNLHPG